MPLLRRKRKAKKRKKRGKKPEENEPYPLEWGKPTESTNWNGGVRRLSQFITHFKQLGGYIKPKKRSFINTRRGVRGSPLGKKGL